MRITVKFYENRKKIWKFNNEERCAQQCLKIHNKVTIIKGYGMEMRKDLNLHMCIYMNVMSVKAIVLIQKGKNRGCIQKGEKERREWNTVSKTRKEKCTGRHEKFNALEQEHDGVAGDKGTQMAVGFWRRPNARLYLGFIQ